MAKPLFKIRRKMIDSDKMMTLYFVYLLNPFDSSGSRVENFDKIYGDNLVSRFKDSEAEDDVLRFLRNSPHRVFSEEYSSGIVSLDGRYFRTLPSVDFYNSNSSRILRVSSILEIHQDKYVRRSKKELRSAVAGDLSLCDKSKINGIAERHWRKVFDNILNNGGTSEDLSHSFQMYDHEPALAELESYGYELKKDFVDL